METSNKYMKLLPIAIIIAACPAAYLTFKLNAELLRTNRIVQIVLGIMMTGLIIIMSRLEVRPMTTALYISLFVISCIVGFVGYLIIDQPEPLIWYYPFHSEMSWIYSAIYIAGILFVAYSKLGRIYLPVLIIMCPISIEFHFRQYDKLTWLPYFALVLSIIVQIAIAIISVKYTKVRHINKIYNLVLGVVLFTIVNQITMVAIMIFFYGITWKWYFVLPVPYIITTLITMHFIKPRKVLTEGAE